MKRKQHRTQAVDEVIRDSLKEPENYAFSTAEEASAHLTQEQNVEEGEEMSLFRLSDAGLSGRHTYFERESLFARVGSDRAHAKAEMARTAREIHRRKIVKRNEANKAFAGPAVTDMEAGYDQERMAA